MEDGTFRSRLVDLMKKSRQAVRLYNSVNRNPRDPNSIYNEMQAEEWRNVNAELLRLLAAALDHPNNKKLTADVFAIRDRFLEEWTQVEQDLNVRQQALRSSAETGDFIKAALLSKDLVAMKARLQAAQAVHHELNDVIKKSRVSLPTIELSTVVAAPPAPSIAKVIPLRRNGAG